MSKSIRFVKRFVLFCNVVKLQDGKLTRYEEQYHVDFGEHHKVSTFEPKSENSVLIEFAEGDKFEGTATIDKSYVELLGGGERLVDPCCGNK